MTNGDSVWIRDQDRLEKIQGRIQHPRSFVIETEMGTVRRNRSALVKAELQSPSKVDKQATFTSTASDFLQRLCYALTSLIIFDSQILSNSLFAIEIQA